MKLLSLSLGIALLAATVAGFDASSAQPGDPGDVMCFVWSMK